MQNSALDGQWLADVDFQFVKGTAPRIAAATGLPLPQSGCLITVRKTAILCRFDCHIGSQAPKRSVSVRLAHLQAIAFSLFVPVLERWHES
ncbi:MAG: hypothetical protein ABTR92_14430 [Candidatus Accumulibacter phosphatis]|jgi:hypothetical protein|uniref:hypothetical protein n=1 Tax=Candidatus Accumulibacter sp. ACC012 TaxID=2823332 RepID=UPI0025C144FE|nr:hypothetical protein [Candidatus Accumulibacter sp. ACC012]